MLIQGAEAMAGKCYSRDWATAKNGLDGELVCKDYFDGVVVGDIGDAIVAVEGAEGLEG